MDFWAKIVVAAILVALVLVPIIGIFGAMLSVISKH